MYGLIDYHLAEVIIHSIGRRQAAEEALQVELPLEARRRSLLTRLRELFFQNKHEDCTRPALTSTACE